MSFDRTALRLISILSWLALFTSGIGVLPGQESAEESTLVPGSVVERQLAGGQAHSYRVTLAAGEYARVVVEQRGIDVIARVVDPRTQATADFDSESRKQGQEVVGIASDAPVTYQLRILAKYPKVAAGRYVVRLEELRAADAKDRALFEAHKLTTEGIRLEDGGKYNEAFTLAERALALGEQAAGPDDAYLGSLLLRLAGLQRRKGAYAASEKSYLRAIAAYEKALGRENPQTAAALRGLGNVYMYTSEYSKAEPLLNEQLGIMERTLGKDDPGIIGSLGYLSLLHQRKGDMERALLERQRTVALAEKDLASDDPALIQEVSNLGDLYSLMGDNERAQPLLERALHLVQQRYGPDHPYVAIPMQNLGIIARQNRQYDRALELLNGAQRIREKALGASHPQSLLLLINIANVYGAKGDYAHALELHLKTLGIFETVAGPYHEYTLDCLSNVARTYAALGDMPHAIEYRKRLEAVVEKNIESNLSVGSEREKLTYLLTSSQLTDQTVSLNVNQAPGNASAAELAAQVLLQRQGRVLDAMSGNIAALRQRLNPDDRKLFDELGDASARLAKLALGGVGNRPPAEYRTQLAALDEQREKLEAAISQRSAEFRSQSQPVTLAAVQNAIPADAALLEFAVYDPFDPRGEVEEKAYGKARYVAYVLRRNGRVTWKDLGPAEEIDAAVAALRQALADPRRKDVQNLARAMDRRITEPVRPLLGDAKQLLVSPDGELNLIPFEALVDEHGRYLLERYSIHYLSAGRDLLRMQVPRESKSAPLVLADPLFGEPPVVQMAAPDMRPQAKNIPNRKIDPAGALSSVYFAPLAGTAGEARIIQSLFPEAQVLTGPRATITALQRAEAPSILHIATHGFFLTETAAAQPAAPGTRAIRANVHVENPLLRSGLALAGANLSKGGSDDGILTALEASNLNLWGTKVVTLSACETGVGEVKNGEGVYGLRRAFFLAGAETLVMSLWAVSDNITRDIMSAYYTGLKQGLGRGEALRQAQLDMLQHKDRQHPFYWAGFIQSGEWKNLDGR